MFNRTISHCVLPVLLGVMACVLAHAQKFPKLPKPGTVAAASTTATKKINPALQAALLHAQTLRKIQLERSVATAVQTKEKNLFPSSEKPSFTPTLTTTLPWD